MAPKSRTNHFFSSIAIVVLAAIFGMGTFGEKSGRVEPFALILIDTDTLACSPCLEPLQAVCRAIPPDVQEKRLIGILTFRAGEKSDSRPARIARTRWTGYSRANGILFPSSVDEVHAFNRLSEEGTTILLFDDSAGCIRRWSAPFSSETLRELADFLSDVKPDKMENEP